MIKQDLCDKEDIIEKLQLVQSAYQGLDKGKGGKLSWIYLA